MTHLGAAVGTTDGGIDGTTEGTDDGADVGPPVGTRDGAIDGETVGEGTMTQPFSLFETLKKQREETDIVRRQNPDIQQSKNTRIERQC